MSQFRQAEDLLLAPPSWLQSSAQRVCGQVTFTQGMPQQRLRIILSKVHLEQGSEPLPGLCTWTWDKPAFQPLPGQSVCITRAIKPVNGFANGDNGYESWLFSQKIYWRLWSEGKKGYPILIDAPEYSAQLRAAWEKRFLAILPTSAEQKISQPTAILTALLFGDRFYLQARTIDLFGMGTIAHSLALSGQHLAIAGYAGWAFIMLLAWRHPRIYLWRSRLQLITAASVPAAIGYLWLGNAPASLQRASAMLFFACILLWRKRLPNGIDILCLALAAILLLNPLAAFNTGLQLSVLCVGVILISWPAVLKVRPVADTPRPWHSRLFWGLAQVLLVSLLIQLALLPFTLTQFQQVGFWFVLNVFWLPLLGLITLPCAFAALLLCLIPIGVFQALATCMAYLGTLPCDLIIALLKFLQAHGFLEEPAFLVPHWTAMLGYALLGCGIAWLLGGSAPRHARNLLLLGVAFLACGAALRFWASLGNEVSMEVLDVGQGQAVLIKHSNGQQILVDGGGSYSTTFDIGRSVVAPYLSRNRHPGLAAVINTHPDQDHVGGLFYVIRKLPSGIILHNGRNAPGTTDEKWEKTLLHANSHILHAGDELIWGKTGLRFQILHPPRDSSCQGNGASLVLRLMHGSAGLALLPGDVTASAQKLLLAAGADLTAQVALAPHHGSAKDMVKEFYLAANPQVVIASCGFGNHWGYPSPQLRKFLQQRKITLLDTGASGKIAIRWYLDPASGIFTFAKVIPQLAISRRNLNQKMEGKDGAIQAFTP